MLMMFKEIIKAISMLMIFGVIFMIILIFVDKYHNKNNNVVEQDVELQKYNDSLKIEVNNLDSIKNAKVIEVKTLDNDSTVKLFYQLIK